MVVSEATTDTTEGFTVSERSTSVTVSVPLVLRAALLSASVFVVLSTPTTLITGASSLPVMTMVTVCGLLSTLWLSVALTV